MMNTQSDKSIVLGFSGGMDSITAARKLIADGWSIVAVTLDITGDKPLINKAEAAAKELGIEHCTLDIQPIFQREIIDYFISEYKNGHTPAPCTLCNSHIKWKYLTEFADSRGIEKVATGHYFRIEQENGKFFVARAADLSKDQSYYLWDLSQNILSRALTPMCDMMKRDVKENFTDKRESMGVCFLQGINYREFLTQHCPEVVHRGDIVNINGQTVGTHDGIAFYTIGQKRGLEGLEAGQAVIDIDADKNRLIVGPADKLYKSILEIKQCNVVDNELFINSNDVSIIIRGIGRNPDGYIRSKLVIDDGYRIVLDNPAWAPAIGQPVVFYRQNRVLGGGFITGYF